MNKTAISIIVSIYEVEEFIKDALDSILQQDINQPYNVIMIDTNSKDKSFEIAKEYAKKYANFYAFHYDINLGPSLTRNIGLNIALGEYITFLDGDDFLEKNYLSTLYNIAKETNSSLVGCSFNYVDNKVKKNKGVSLKLTGKKALFLLYLDKHRKIKEYCWGKLYKTSLLKENNLLFDCKLFYYEDLLFLGQVLTKCEEFYLIKDCLYNHRNNSKSLTSNTVDKVTPYLNSLDEFASFLIKNNRDLFIKLFKTHSHNLKKCTLSIMKNNVPHDRINKKEILSKIDEIYIRHNGK